LASGFRGSYLLEDFFFFIIIFFFCKY